MIYCIGLCIDDLHDYLYVICRSIRRYICKNVKRSKSLDNSRGDDATHLKDKGSWAQPEGPIGRNPQHLCGYS